MGCRYNSCPPPHPCLQPLALGWGPEGAVLVCFLGKRAAHQAITATIRSPQYSTQFINYYTAAKPFWRLWRHKLSRRRVTPPPSGGQIPHHPAPPPFQCMTGVGVGMGWDGIGIRTGRNGGVEAERGVEGWSREAAREGGRQGTVGKE